MLVQWAILATTRQGLEHSSPGSGRPPTSPAHTLGTTRQRMSGWKVDLLLPAGGWDRVLGTTRPPKQRLPPNAQAPEQPGLGHLGGTGPPPASRPPRSLQPGGKSRGCSQRLSRKPGGWQLLHGSPKPDPQGQLALLNLPLWLINLSLTISSRSEIPYHTSCDVLNSGSHA